MIKKDFIYALRKEGGYSQEYVASKLGMSRPSYVLIEDGRKELTLTQAQKLASLYGMSISDLLSGTKKEYSFEVLSDSTEANTREDIRISIPQKNLEKFKEVLLYVLEKVGSKPNVGMTVLYKLLYFIDFDYYEKFEEQLMGATYIKNHFGPTPLEFKKVVSAMIEDGELEEVRSKYFKKDQTKYFPIRRAKISLLNGQEIKHIDEVISRLSDKNATELSDYSHKDVPWITAGEGEALNYESVFYRTDETSVREYEEDTVS